MTESVSVSSGIASRYAAALFDLAIEGGDVDMLDSNIDAVRDVLERSRDFRSLINSPIYSRDEMGAAVDKVAVKIGLGQLMRNTLGLMAEKRRLFVLPVMLDRLEALLDERRGVVTAEIVAARELSESEMKTLSDTLCSASGKVVRFKVKVDNGLIGGITARLGSKLVDASVKTKLANLKNALKEIDIPKEVEIDEH